MLDSHNAYIYILEEEGGVLEYSYELRLIVVYETYTLGNRS
jgi:hypothetical protein